MADDTAVTDPGIGGPAPNQRARQRFPMPWGLFAALGVYAALVAGYLQATYWSSPEYQAIEHYDRAWEVLGPAEGRTSSRDELVAAYEHLLEAARLAPHVTRLHEQLERLNWRFEERHLSMPPDLRKRADSVSIVWKRIQEDRAPILVVGAREHGWAPDQLREGPGRTIRWSMIGVVLIIAGWAYVRFSSRRVAQTEHEKELDQMERDVRALAGHRADTDPESQSPFTPSVAKRSRGATPPTPPRTSRSKRR